MATIDRKKRLVVFGLIVLAVVFADQYTKRLVSETIPPHSGVVIVPGLFNIVHARNPGAAFGILSDSRSIWRLVLFTGIACIAFAVILWLILLPEETDRLLFVGCGLFFGGALGNFIDRIRVGEVVDMLDVYVGAYHWPAFNVADIGLCVGTGLFLLHLVLAERKH